MRVYIPDVKDYISGPKTFLTNLTTYMSDKVTLVEDPMKSDLMIIVAAYNMDVLAKAKAKNIKIIQRLDGISYPSKHPTYKELNADVHRIYNEYADHIVFQSDYSKQQCFAMFGNKNVKDYSLIINGVNKVIFQQNTNKSLGNKIKFVTTGSFRNIDMIEPIIRALDSLSEKYEFEFNIIGTIRNPDIKHFFNRPYINMLGELPMEEVAIHLANNDIFLFSHLNPPCPNSVIEAISSALPIVSFDSGAMSELVFFSTDLLADVSSDIFQTYNQFDHMKLYQKIVLCIEDFTKYKELAIQNSSLYSFEECGKLYLKVFKSVANNTGFLSRLLSNRL